MISVIPGTPLEGIPFKNVYRYGTAVGERLSGDEETALYENFFRKAGYELDINNRDKTIGGVTYRMTQPVYEEYKKLVKSNLNELYLQRKDTYENLSTKDRKAKIKKLAEDARSRSKMWLLANKKDGWITVEEYR
jgi:hypothetical protein